MESAAILCVLLATVHAGDHLPLVNKGAHLEQKLLAHLRNKLIVNNADYEEITTTKTTTSTNFPLYCIDLRNSTPPTATKTPKNEEDAPVYRQRNKENLYNPFNHPHYKPLHNPGFSSYHKVPSLKFPSLSNIRNDELTSQDPLYLASQQPVHILSKNKNYSTIQPIRPSSRRLQYEHDGPSFAEYQRIKHFEFKKKQDKTKKAVSSNVHPPGPDKQRKSNMGNNDFFKHWQNEVESKTTVASNSLKRAEKTSLEIISSVEEKNVRNEKKKGDEQDLDLLMRLLNQAKRRAERRSTQLPLDFKRYENGYYPSRRSLNYVRWKVSHGLI